MLGFIADLNYFDFTVEYNDSIVTSITEVLNAETVSGAIKEALHREASPYEGSGELSSVKAITIECLGVGSF